MVVQLIVTGILSALMILFLNREGGGSRRSPDGYYYTDGWPAPRPYGSRLLLPLLLHGRSMRWWEIISGLSILGTSLFLCYLGGWFPALLWMGLASTRTNCQLPMLTDQLGMLLMLLLSSCDDWLVGGLLAPFIGLVNEKALVFAFLANPNPFMLLGLGVVGFAWYVSKKPSPQDPQWLQHPLKAALQPNKLAELTDWRIMLAPWGVAAIGLLGAPVPLIIVSYLQVLIAQDRARLYQWIGPYVCLIAGSMVMTYHPLLAVPLITLHFLNPYRRVL